MLQRIRAWELRHQRISALFYLMLLLLVGAYTYWRAECEVRAYERYETWAR